MASSEYNQHYKCTKAIDGNRPNPAWTVTDWASLGEGVGAWLHVDFNDIYRLQHVRLMQRYHNAERFKDVQLTFSDTTALVVSF